MQKNKIIILFFQSMIMVQEYQKKLEKKIFKPFFKEDKSRNLNKTSAGLGLSIVKDIMKQAGGKIYVEDSELGGARVVTIWPNSN